MTAKINVGDHVQVIDYDPWPPPGGYPHFGSTGVVTEILGDLYAVAMDYVDENGMRKGFEFHQHELAPLR
jgi:hypothetical protein